MPDQSSWRRRLRICLALSVGTTITSLPDELLVQAFDQLDDRSISRAVGVCRRWAALARDVFCRKGPPCAWLRAVGLEKYACMVRQLSLARPADLDMDHLFPNVRRLSVALSLLGHEHLGPLIYVVSRCGSPKLPLHVNIVADSSPPGAGRLLPGDASEADERVSSTAFYFLATLARLRSLTIAASLLPACAQNENSHAVANKKHTFSSLVALEMPIAVHGAKLTLSYVSAVRELTLVVTSADMAGEMLQAVTRALPLLRVLSLTFRKLHFLKAARDLPVLERLRALTTLEIHNHSDITHTPSSIAPRQWQAFVSGRPAVETLVLPPTLRLPHPESMVMTGLHWRRLRRLHLFASWDIGLLCRSRRDVLFPCLKTLVIRNLVQPRASRSYVRSPVRVLIGALH
jgi:hypothetical protein